jgi:hypothetical protein
LVIHVHDCAGPGAVSLAHDLEVTAVEMERVNGKMVVEDNPDIARLLGDGGCDVLGLSEVSGISICSFKQQGPAPVGLEGHVVLVPFSIARRVGAEGHVVVESNVWLGQWFLEDWLYPGQNKL